MNISKMIFVFYGKVKFLDVSFPLCFWKAVINLVAMQG